MYRERDHSAEAGPEPGSDGGGGGGRGLRLGKELSGSSAITDAQGSGHRGERK